MICPKCQEEISDKLRYCPYCGVNMTTYIAPQPDTPTPIIQPPSPSSTKKSVFKKWWFWGMIVIAAATILVFSTTLGKNDSSGEQRITTVIATDSTSVSLD